MKKLTLLFTALFGITSIMAQVAINTDGSAPDNSAILDVKSTTAGFLLPRMNTMQLRYISDPVAGLMVFNTDSSDFYGFNGSKWISVWDNTDTITKWSCGYPITDTRDGQEYETRVIGTQCWMGENLNIGTKIDNSPSDNDIIEKYCYNSATYNCDEYGGLYRWDEMMEYSTTEGVQGICPEGWHIPTDAEWKTLEGESDTNYGIGNGIWDGAGWRGYNAGGRLKEAGYDHWVGPNSGATNNYGFTALPGGLKAISGAYSYLRYEAEFWTSSYISSANSAWWRALNYNSAQIYRNQMNKYNALSVRCVR